MRELNNGWEKLRGCFPVKQILSFRPQGEIFKISPTYRPFEMTEQEAGFQDLQYVIGSFETAE